MFKLEFHLREVF